MWEVEENLKITTTGGLKTNGNSFLVLCVCTHREAVIERKSEHKLKGEKRKETLEPRGEGGEPLLSWRRKLGPLVLQEDLHKLTPVPIPTSLQKDMTRVFPFWLVLSKRNAALSLGHLGNEAKWQHRTQYERQLRNSEKHAGFSSPNLILPKKIESFFDISIEEMH